MVIEPSAIARAPSRRTGLRLLIDGGRGVGHGDGSGDLRRLVDRLGLGLDSLLRPTRTRGLAQLADPRLLPDLAAQVIELGAVDVADRPDLDPLDLRRVHRERPLDAYAERLLAHGE